MFVVVASLDATVPWRWNSGNTRGSHKMIEAAMQSASKEKGSNNQISAQRNSSELGHGLLSRWLSSHHHHGGGGVHAEKSVAHHTVNLLTSTIKVTFCGEYRGSNGLDREDNKGYCFIAEFAGPERDRFLKLLMDLEHH
ncbi:hypothetical protein Tco_0781260 [Tanacetum coccineum]